MSDSQETWMQTMVTASAGDKVSFYWKVSSDSGDYLKFYIDGQYQIGITGEVDWQKKSYSATSCIHTFKWRGACPESFQGIKYSDNMGLPLRGRGFGSGVAGRVFLFQEGF